MTIDWKEIVTVVMENLDVFMLLLEKAGGSLPFPFGAVIVVAKWAKEHQDCLTELWEKLKEPLNFGEGESGGVYSENLQAIAEECNVLRVYASSRAA